MHGKSDTDGVNDREPHDKVNWKAWGVPLLVAGFGCVGGFTSWVWLYATEALDDSGNLATIAPHLYLGAIAGFIGVYLLKADSTRIVVHSLALALVCGFGWKPTLEACAQYLDTKVTETEARAKQQFADDRINQLRDATPEVAPELIRDLESVSQELMESQTVIRDPRLRLEVNSVVAQSVAAISEASRLSAQDSAEALAAVAETAEARGNMRVLRAARSRPQAIKDPRRAESLEERRRRKIQEPE